MDWLEDLKDLVSELIDEVYDMVGEFIDKIDPLKDCR